MTAPGGHDEGASAIPAPRRSAQLAPLRPIGVLLAAGAGSRMGRPKALVIGDDGKPWLARGVHSLQAGGCAEVVVVLGASAARAQALLDSAPTIIVEAQDWAEGISASLRAGLAAAAERGASVAVVTLVDLPQLDPRSVSRALDGASVSTLRQAIYEGRPGHPVVIGSEHFSALNAHLAGDVGARPYLLAHGVDLVDCSDLGGGDDVDVEVEVEVDDVHKPRRTR